MFREEENVNKSEIDTKEWKAWNVFVCANSNDLLNIRHSKRRIASHVPFEYVFDFKRISRDETC